MAVVNRNITKEFVLDDELEEGEIREVEEENTLHFLNSPSYFDDLEEGEITEEKGDGENTVHVLNCPSYFDDLEEGEIREEECPSYTKGDKENLVHVLDCPAYFDDLEEGEIREEECSSHAAPTWDQHVTTVIEVPPSEETTVREKVCVENHAKTTMILQCCHEERESEETNTVKDHAKGPREKSLARQVEEVYSKRSRELLSLQDLELKKFKLLKKLHELEFEVNCSGKLSIQDFEILRDKFDKHMKGQHRTFRAMLIEARKKEENLKEQWLEKAREGTLEESFCEIPLPVMGFKMESFDYGSEMEDVLVQNRSCPSNDMHLDVVEDERCSGSEALLEAREESDHMMAEVSHSNDNVLDAMCVEPIVITKSPSISSTSSNFEGEEMSREKNERGCNETAMGLPSNDMHVDVVEDEGCSGSEALLEARVESDYMMAEVSHSNDNVLDAMCVDPVVITKSPSISSTSSNFEGEEMSGEKNERGCNETAMGVHETLAQNLNPDPSHVIISNSNFVCEEVTLEEHEPECTDTVSIGLAEANMQNTISDTNSLPRNACSDQIVVTDPTPHPITRSQVCQNPAISLPYNSNVTTPTNLSLSPGRNDIAEAPLVNQNEAPVEQAATQIPSTDGDILAQLLQMVRHGTNVDPLQNELTVVRNAQKILTERHNEKIARLRAEYERELDNTRRKYYQMEVEADAQLSGHRAHLNMAYQKVCMNLRLAKDFQDMFKSPNSTGQLPINGIEGREQFCQSSYPQFNPNSILRPASPYVAQPPLSSSHYGLPNPYTTQVRQPLATFAPLSGQRPVFPMQSPQYFPNQPTLMHSTLAHAPIGVSGFGNVHHPGLPQLNQLRPSSLSMPIASFRNI